MSIYFVKCLNFSSVGVTCSNSPRGDDSVRLGHSNKLGWLQPKLHLLYHPTKISIYPFTVFSIQTFNCPSKSEGDFFSACQRAVVVTRCIFIQSLWWDQSGLVTQWHVSDSLFYLRRYYCDLCTHACCQLLGGHIFLKSELSWTIGRVVCGTGTRTNQIA